jgi:hypothetical protein
LAGFLFEFILIPISGCTTMTIEPLQSTSASSESQAWEALKTLGDAALAQGGLQAVLQMFVGTLTGAEEVARASEEAGHPETMTPEVIAQWISTDYAPGMHQALAQGTEDTPK